MNKLKDILTEGFTKYTIKLTKTPGWYLVHDKNGKQKFEGDRKFVTKHLKKLKTRMGSHQLKSLIQVADKYKGKGVTFDVVESIDEAKFSNDQIEILRKSYGTLSRMNPSSPTYKKFIKFLEKLPKDQLKQLAAANIKFVSMLAKNRIKGESVNEAPGELPRATLNLLNSKLNKASETIIKITDKYKNQGDIDGLVKIWMRGLHLRLKKSGVKI